MRLAVGDDGDVRVEHNAHRRNVAVERRRGVGGREDGVVIVRPRHRRAFVEPGGGIAPVGGGPAVPRVVPRDDRDRRVAGDLQRKVDRAYRHRTGERGNVAVAEPQLAERHTRDVGVDPNERHGDGEVEILSRRRCDAALPVRAGGHLVVAAEARPLLDVGSRRLRLRLGVERVVPARPDGAVELPPDRVVEPRHAACVLRRHEIVRQRAIGRIQLEVVEVVGAAVVVIT